MARDTPARLSGECAPPCDDTVASPLSPTETLHGCVICVCSGTVACFGFPPSPSLCRRHPSLLLPPAPASSLSLVRLCFPSSPCAAAALLLCCDCDCVDALHTHAVMYNAVDEGSPLHTSPAPATTCRRSLLCSFALPSPPSSSLRDTTV
jgi:hypothetical protein